MFKFISFLGELAVIALILFGTWPIILGKPLFKPIIKPSAAESVKDAIADKIKNFSLD